MSDSISPRQSASPFPWGESPGGGRLCTMSSIRDTDVDCAGRGVAGAEARRSIIGLPPRRAAFALVGEYSPWDQNGTFHGVSASLSARPQF